MKMVALKTLVWLLSIAIGPAILMGQGWRPITNEHGDTLRTSIVSADSNYKKDEVIFFFKDSSLNKGALCSSFEWTDAIVDKGEGVKEVQTSGMMSQSLRVHVMSEQLSLASVINDAALVSYLQSVGGQYFTRITAASPCSEQKSITRRGDTIPSLDHCYYLLKLNNDTSVQQVVVTSTLLFSASTYYAQPNFLYRSHRIPGDPLYTDQKGLQLAYMNVQRLWDLWTGLPSTLVAVIDNGISYMHCEFGPNGEGNLGGKVVDGFNYKAPGQPWARFSDHGTAVASIIGAYTNRATCGVDLPLGMAGIAGGWGPQGGGIDDGGGVKLLGLKVGDFDQTRTAEAIAAIREAAGDKTTFYSKFHNAWAADVIMLSHTATALDIALEDAVMYARNHNIPIICPPGNTYDETRTYPTAFGDWRCISVGAGDKDLNRIRYSNYQDGIDLIAPGGDDQSPLNVGANEVFTVSKWSNFAGTSASAPNVAGIVAALHNNLLVETESEPTFLAQEDYEGLLAATAKDRTNDNSPFAADRQSYLVGYDKRTGWGHADAGKIVENKGEGYILRHYDTYEPLITTYQPWSNRSNWVFNSAENRVNKDIPVGKYLVAYRKVAVTIPLPSGWDRTKNLYVWGRGGQIDNGYDLANPNYCQGYTRGEAFQELGNNLTEPILLPEDKNSISLFTFQMRLHDLIFGKLVGVYPPDDEIKYSYTIYGVRSTTGVGDVQSGGDLIISPNPSSTNGVSLNGVSIIPGARFRVLSAIGGLVLERTLGENEQGHLRLDTSHWPSGVYHVSLTFRGTTTSSSFLITR
ncbi:MAG: hypothetical protein FGM32_11190 [Candidatus Kapabacteria bacterium]|nr:hypothetical protein [Candidatus Kapabacteria bacterium]